MAKAELMDYDEAIEMFEPVLGFEVHVELNTRTKMFSTRRTSSAASPTPTSHPSTSVSRARCPS